MTRRNRRRTQSGEKISAEEREKLRLARRCFESIGRMETMSAGYPPGHPSVEEALDNVHDAFHSLFYQTDRLSVRVEPHSLCLVGTDQTVWETSRPNDYCFALHRDGVYLLNFLSGVTRRQLRKFVAILEDLVDSDSPDVDAVHALSEADFNHISLEAFDASLAWLAGIDLELVDEPVDEQRAIRRLFDRAFDAQDEIVRPPEDAVTMEQKLVVDAESQAQRQRRQNVGTDHVLNLPPAQQKQLQQLKTHLSDADEFEARHGELLANLLSAGPNQPLRDRAIDHIAEIMVRLLEGDAPWEAVTFLKTINRWKQAFDRDVAQQVRTALNDALGGHRSDRLVEQVASEDRDVRQGILQMFHALDLDEASAKIVALLEWELTEETVDDIFRYLKKRAKTGLGFIDDILETLPEERTARIIDIAAEALPDTRVFLLNSLKMSLDTDVKVRALEALKGHWEDPRDIRTYVTPLLNHLNEDVRVLAIESVAEAAPKHVRRVLTPLVEGDLAAKSERELKALITTFAQYGGPKAAEKLDSLIRRRGIVSKEKKETAATIAKLLINAPTPPVTEMLKSVADDWLVAGQIRSACREVTDVIG